MQRKTEIIIAVVVILLLAAVIFLLFRSQPAPTRVEPVPNVQIDEPTKTSTGVTKVPTAQIPSTGAVSAATIARSFVERFGSFSSETNYLNVDDVKALATESFAQELEKIAETARKNATDGYYGISTRLLTTATKEEAVDTAIIIITTQREEATGSPANTNVFVQDITVELQKVGDSWLVNGFSWEKV